MKSNKIDIMYKYVFYTYLLFWFMVLGIGGVAIFVFEASPTAMRFITTLCSWAPTIVLLMMLKKLKPGLSVGNFYKNALREKLNFRVLSISALLIVGIFLAAAWTVSIFEGVGISSQLNFVAAALLGNILFTAAQGASGEESGWRGYLMPEMEAKYGFLKGNLILGLVWAFWHLPLWFVSSGYSGMELVLYIVSFIIGLTAFSMIISVFMKKCNNLILAFWMHFWFNFVLSFFVGKDLFLLAAYAILYSAAAGVYTGSYIKKSA